MMKTRFEHVPPGQTDPDPLPGDFILTHGGEFWSRVIHFGQGLRFAGKDRPYTFWNHTALVVSADGAIIEALGPGVQRNTLAAYKGTQYTIVHIDASDEDRREMVGFAEHAERGFGDPRGNLAARIGELRAERKQVALDLFDVAMESRIEL